MCGFQPLDGNKGKVEIRKFAVKSGAQRSGLRSKISCTTLRGGTIPVARGRPDPVSKMVRLFLLFI